MSAKGKEKICEERMRLCASRKSAMGLISTCAFLSSTAIKIIKLIKNSNRIKKDYDIGCRFDNIDSYSTFCEENEARSLMNLIFDFRKHTVSTSCKS